MAVVRWLAVALLVGAMTGTAAAEDYPVVDAPVPVFARETPKKRYVDDIPIVQDSIAEPWEPMKRLPRCGCDGLAVPDGW